MSTVLKHTFLIEGAPNHHSGPGVFLGCVDRGEGTNHLSTKGYVDRAEFLAAVATECDAIIIPRADLPNVTDEGDRITTPDESWPMVSARRVGAAGFRRDALSGLALAEYLDAHPPVDPIDMDVLVDLLGQIPDGTGTRERVALHLLHSGRITIKEA